MYTMEMEWKKPSYTTDRVMTVSFHKYGLDADKKKKFFPGTSGKDDVGAEGGKYYSINIPLDHGIDDLSFSNLFRPIISKVIQVYTPEAIVLQAGADSLYGDRLGEFNLSIKGHADCLKHLMSFDIPLMLLGGGGYTIENVARCWCYETAVAIGVEGELDEQLPDHKFINSYQGNQRTLHFPVGTVPNKNLEDELIELRNLCLERVSQFVHAPSVQFHETPAVFELPEAEDDERC